MKKTKTIYIDTLIYDYSLIEEKLTKLAAEGWHLEKVGPLGWKFRRGEPKQVSYAVTYAPSASAFNSRPTEAEEDLSDLCAQAGWVRVATQAQMHIYRNEDPGATPLETDDAEKLRNIGKSMMKHFFPTEALVVVVFLLQFFMHMNTLNSWPGRTLSSPMMISTLVMSLFVAVIHVILTVNDILWLRRARRDVAEGEPIPVNRFYRRFRFVVWAFLLGYLLCLLGSEGTGFLGWVLVTSAAVLLTTAGALSLCKKLNAPRWVNMVVPAGLCVLVIAVLGTMLFFSIDCSLEELPTDTDTPLTLQQLTGETDTEREVLEEHSSILSAYGRYWEKGADDARLSYTIVDVKCPLFYDMLLNEQEAEFMQTANFLADMNVSEVAVRFDAEYGRHYVSDLGDYWLICWDNRIVYLKASWELTEAQTAVLAEALKP